MPDDRCAATIEKGPFYALELYPSLFNTQGGPKRNGKGEVLDPFDVPIPDSVMPTRPYFLRRPREGYIMGPRCRCRDSTAPSTNRKPWRRARSARSRQTSSKGFSPVTTQMEVGWTQKIVTVAN